MILVLADDLSGAAEIGGIAVSRGLSAEVHLDVPAACNSDLAIIDTDSRSCSPDAAADRVSQIWSRLGSPQRFDWIYQKVDSVLRGPVLPEMRRLLVETRMAAALLIPANPHRGRIIRGGDYWIAEQRLSETAFARDPEYPARSSRVLDLLGNDAERDCHPLPAGAEFAAAGIWIPDITSADELADWAQRLPADWLPVGAAEFFEALLQARTGAAGDADASTAAHRLMRTVFVCGSSVAWEKGRGDDCRVHQIPIVPLAPEPDGPSPAQAAESALAAIEARGAVMLQVLEDLPNETRATDSGRLLPTIASIREREPRSEPTRWCLEGGATASAVLRGLGEQTHLPVRHQYAPGVVALDAADRRCEFVIKPGSYDWPTWFYGGEQTG